MMTRAFCLSAAMLLALAGCREETAADLPPPVAMTAEAVGHYCQMELLEHPGPKAQVHLTGLPDPLFFSQVRDAIAYQRMPEQSHMIAVIYVSDMGAAPGWENPGAENWIEATGAHYVLGAEVAGGMGAPELVPFSDPEAAEAFAARHGGEVRRLSDIADTDVLAPAEIGHSGAPSGDDDIDPGTDDSLTDRLRALTRDEES